MNKRVKMLFVLTLLILMIACQPKVIEVTRRPPSNATLAASTGGYKVLGGGLVRVDDTSKGVFCYFLLGSSSGSPVCFK